MPDASSALLGCWRGFPVDFTRKEICIPFLPTSVGRKCQFDRQANPMCFTTSESPVGTVPKREVPQTV